jgi:hypothetical protein
MIRKGFFGLLLLTAVIVAAACGRQVTPNPPGIGAGGAPVGYMVVKFDVAAPFNFANYQYWVVFNTTGNGQTPSTMPFNNNYAGYSGGIAVGGSNGGTYANAYQWIKNSNPNLPPALLKLGTTAQQLQYTADSNGTGTEFTVLFQRQILASIVGTPTPAPTTTPSPGTTPTPTPLPFSSNWTFNAFVTQGNLQGQPIFVDSMGAGGPVNPQYVCCSPPLVITQNSDNVYYALFSGGQLDPTAQIVSIEIGNNFNQQ